MTNELILEPDDKQEGHVFYGMLKGVDDSEAENDADAITTDDCFFDDDGCGNRR